MAATALGVLPFLAAGQTHETKGPFQKTVYEGRRLSCARTRRRTAISAETIGKECTATAWPRSPWQCLRDDENESIACSSERVQRAVNFIESAQNRETGGWRYFPGDDGDTSVFGWQVLALKSAEKAGLKVDPKTYEGARKWLNSVAVGEPGGRFAYRPSPPATPSMTAVGLLCNVLLGVKPDDPTVADGAEFVLENLPSKETRNCYYWYDATQAMHLLRDKRWDRWNRSLRGAVLDTQVKEGCAAGSWDPDKPTKDAWGRQGGRLMVTSLSCLSLEVYYRYLPVFRFDNAEDRPASKESDRQ